MNIIRENLPNVVYKQSYMSVTTFLYSQIFIYRQSDKSFRIEYEGGQCEYYSEPEKVLEAIDYDIIKVKIFFPSLNEVIQIYG
jgi:hypothetical protein